MSSKLTLEYAELAMAGEESIALYAYRRSQKCPWKYGFDFHYRSAKAQADRFSKNLVWC